MEKYKANRGMSQAELLAFLLSTPRRGTGPDPDQEERRRRFWTHMARAVPMRPRPGVQAHLRNLLDPNARKASWTEQEKSALRLAVEDHGTVWVTVANILGRPRTECYIAWIRMISPETDGRGTVEEVAALQKGSGNSSVTGSRLVT